MRQRVNWFPLHPDSLETKTYNKNPPDTLRRFAVMSQLVPTTQAGWKPKGRGCGGVGVWGGVQSGMLGLVINLSHPYTGS